MSGYFDQIYYEVIRSLGSKENRYERVKNALMSLSKYAVSDSAKGEDMKKEIEAIMNSISGENEEVIDRAVDWIAKWSFSHNRES